MAHYDNLPRITAARARAYHRTTWLPAHLAIPRAMASAPTITSGSASAGGTLTRTFWAATDSAAWLASSTPYGDHFSFSRTPIGKTSAGAIGAGTNFAYNFAVTSGTGSTLAQASTQVSFLHGGQMLEIMVGQNGGYFMVRVDGEYVSLTPVAATSGGGTTYYKLDFGSRGFRRIDVIGSVMSFRGVTVEPSDTLFAAPVRGPRVIVLGDSFSQPIANNGFHWVAKFADIMGWDDVWAMGVSGTGFVADNSGAAKTFGDRLASDVIAHAPDICIVLGGVNDGTANAAQAGVNAASLVAAFRAALPDAVLIGGYNASKGIKTLAAGHLDTMDAVGAAFEAGGAVWCNPHELPLAYAGGTLPNTTLSVSHAAARAGNTGTQGTASSTTGIRCVVTSGSAVNLRVGSTVEVGSGATRERVVINGKTQIAANDMAYAFDGALQYAHDAGVAVTEVGPSYLTGRGYVGATTGWGNADVLTGSDGVHPSDDGHTALALAMAGLVGDALKGLLAR